MHIAADAEIADTVLLPGDPLRAKWIAETYLDGAQQVTSIRNMLGFTGTFDGRSVTVMGSGMGIPSVSLYATELVREFGVKRIVRIGSCGALLPEVKLGDVIVVTGASTDSGVNRTRTGGWDLAAVADFDTVRRLVAAVGAAPVHIGTVLTSDLFYEPENGKFDRAGALGHLAVEMEAAGLFGVAAEEGIAAAALLTVSDHLITEEQLTPGERENGFASMVEMALKGVTSPE